MSHETRAEFDQHAEGYEDATMKGLRASGESQEYFARGRVAHLRAWWLAAGRAEPGRILDFGCGIGTATPMLAEAFPETPVLGLDPSEASVERARAERSGDRVAFRCLRPDLRTEPADLIYLNGVVHHVSPTDRPSFMRKLAGLLRPDGVVAVYDNNPANPGTRWVMSRIPFDRDAVPVWPSSMRDGLVDAGLRPLRTDFLFYFPAFLKLLRPLEPYLSSVPLGAQYGVLAAAPGEDAREGR